MDVVNNDVLKNLGLGPARNSDGPRTNNPEDLGVNDFMTLMLAQIKHQDPFEPMQSGEFISQLAQFGTVSGIDKLQTSFNSLSESMFSNQALQAASLIGRHVQVKTDKGAYINGDVLTGTVDLPENASDVTVRIVDQNGVQVESMDFGDQNAGSLDFMWNGEQSGSGLYRVTAQGIVDGKSTGLDTYLDVPVGSVSFNGTGGGIELDLVNGEAVDFGQVREIR